MMGNKNYNLNDLKPYVSDLKNLYYVVDYLTVENENEMNSILECMNKEEKSVDKQRGQFTMKINNKFLIVERNIIKNHLKDFYSFLLSFNRKFSTDNQDNLDIEHLIEILSLTNLVLIFASANSTFYNLKKKILLYLKKSKNIKDTLILSEYFFTSIVNRTMRKNSISWDYRYFIISNFYDVLNIKDINEKNTNKQDFSKFFEILEIKQDKNDLSFIKVDIDNFNSVNEIEKRNYHMWKYMNLLIKSNFLNDHDKMYLYLYVCSLFGNCFWDYSAYTFIINFSQFVNLNQTQISSLSNYYLSIQNIYKSDQHKSYLPELITNLNK